MSSQPELTGATRELKLTMEEEAAKTVGYRSWSATSLEMNVRSSSPQRSQIEVKMAILDPVRSLGVELRT